MVVRLLIIVSIIPIIFTIKIQQFELSQENKNLIQAVKVMRQELFQSSMSTAFKLLFVPDPDIKNLHNAIKAEIIKNSFKFENLRFCDISSEVQYPTRYTVSVIDNIKAFRANKNHIDLRRYHYAGFHTVMLLEGNFEDVHEIFSAFWSKNIYNVVALINHNGTLLLDFDPYRHPQKCGQATPKVINRFENGKFLTNIETEKKFFNMNRCPVTITTYADTITVSKQNFPNGSFILRGHEARLVQTLSEMMNFTINLRFRDGLQQWGLIYDNGTFTRGFGDLHDRKTDILFGNLYLKELRQKYFDSSASFLNQPAILVLSQQAKLNMLEKLLSPFQSVVWILLMITIFFGIIAILMINFKFKFLRNLVYGTKVSHPIVNMFTAIIGQPQTILPKQNFARFILMMTFIMFLVIRSIYQGYLYKFLQSDGRHKEPQTVEELIDKKYIFILYESNLDLIQNFQPRIRYRIRPASGNKTVNLDTFIGTKEQIAYFGSKVELIFYSSKHDEFPFKICKEQFATINVVLYFNKNFILKRTIDEAINRILIHGFMKHWMREFDKTDKWKYKDVNPIVMNFEHLSGAFYLLAIGNFVALGVFLGEMLVEKLKFYTK